MSWTFFTTLITICREKKKRKKLTTPGKIGLINNINEEEKKNLVSRQIS